MAGTAIGAVVTYYGAKSARDAAKDSSRAYGRAYDAATAEQARQYDQSRQDMMPWLNLGNQAVGGLQDLLNGDYSKFKTSPDYQFRYDQGLKALDRGAAARGSLYSGGTDADRIDYGQGMATQSFNDWRNSLFNMAGMGQTQSQSLASLGQNYANQMGQNAWNLAGARSSSYGQRADADAQLGFGLGGLLNNYGQGRGWW